MQRMIADTTVTTVAVLRPNTSVVTLLVQLGLRVAILGNLSKDVFERRTSTGSETFSLFICLDSNKSVLLSFFSLIKMIYPRV